MVLVEPIKIKALLVHSQRNGRSGAGILRDKWRILKESFIIHVSTMKIIFLSQSFSFSYSRVRRASSSVRFLSQNLFDNLDKFDCSNSRMNENVILTPPSPQIMISCRKV